MRRTKNSGVTSGSKSASSTELAIGVTQENYRAKGMAFIDANGGKVFVICKRHCRWKGDGPEEPTHPATPLQWMAWMNYFARKKICAPLMDTMDYYTVPTEWPHLFDAEATIQEDMR